MLKIGQKYCALKNGPHNFAHNVCYTEKRTKRSTSQMQYVKTHFGFAFQFFLLISDSLGGVVYVFQFSVYRAGTSKIGLPP